jgi:signal transduction histidine kinase
MGLLLSHLFDPSGLTPHGFCLLWEPGLIWLQAVSDGLIGVAYFSIPLALIAFVRRRTDLAFGWIFWLFAIFILACGTTHFMAILTLWEPFYWLEGVIKALTAFVSVLTAIVLWPMIPRALALPSPAALRGLNEALALQVAERDRAAAELRVREEQLRQSQKMEAVGQLTGGIAHDFNNLLTVIAGSLELLRRRVGEGDAAMLRLVENAQQGAHRAATLTRGLLAFSRQQPLSPKPVDANRLLGHMSELLRRTLGERYVLETVLAGGLWHTHADPNQIESAVLNLVVNARDAMPEGGRLTIETANTYLDEEYAAAHGPELRAGQYVMLAVSDTGCGMTPEVMARAFDPFFTTKPPGAGTGLGLSQIFGFAKQSSGHVQLYSEPGHGTTVKLYLPRFIGPVPAAIEPPAPVPLRGAAAGERILVVEDEGGVRAFTCAALREAGYEVLEAPTAGAALQVLAGDPGIVLLLTDLGLPDGNGRTLAETAREARPELKVLFASGYARAAVVHNGRLDADVRLLSKPFTMDRLLAAVRGALDED